jgi:hypothetical protein
MAGYEVGGVGGVEGIEDGVVEEFRVGWSVQSGKILYMPYDISSFYTLLRADAASKYFLMSY